MDRIESLIGELTLEEKVSILSGSSAWHTTAVPRLNIPRVKMTDGPIGARGDSISGATSACFPSASCLSSSWDKENIENIARAIGIEAKSKDADVLLGPTINLHRHPLGGRHFENYSEDPFLVGKLATAYVKGVQSKNVSACLKHFIANDTEFERHTVSSNVDERTLREVYLLPFEMGVIEGKSKSVMSAYNKLNNIYCSSHKELLVDILKNEWGFDGYVVSDWGAALETIENANGGLDLEMPGPGNTWGEKLLIAISEGLVKEEIINDSDQEDEFQLYYQDDEDFVDLCKGPHLPNLNFIGAYKLTTISGAYWKGDSSNTMLTRIYGTAWSNEKDLNEHLNNIEEAQKRDHRKLGKEMDLFHFQDEAPGMVFWHPNGWSIYRNLRNFVRKRLQENDYIEVNTPQVIDRKLWEASGHWDKYRENMFITEVDEEHANEKRVNALKPMNCPGHVQIYNQGIKSYKDLPLKYAEFGLCHRYEPSGTMHGLMRVRAFTQDDGHILCTEDQIESETGLFIEFLSNLYADLGFKDFDIKLSTRPEMRVGSDEIWDKAEEALEVAIKNLGYPYRIDEGDGAFYGPKLDFVLTDAIGREWQCGTFQLDFNLAERLDATYIGEDGKKHIPVMIHRAVLGSFERFIGILIENYAGKLPFWLTPQQVVIASIVSDANDYALEIQQSLKDNKIRCEVDLRNEKISYKVREHSTKKVPIILAIGKKEMADKTVSLRRIGSKESSVLSLDDAIKDITKESRA